MHAKTDPAIRLLVATPPEFGAPVALAEGFHWLRLPIPFKLNHVNVWLLDDGDGWSAVDCAANTREARAMWDAAFAGVMGGRPLNRLIATHGHPDHVGLASWLVEQRGLFEPKGRRNKRPQPDFVSTLAEWLQPQIWVAARRRAATPSWTQFFTGHGCPPEMLLSLAKSQSVDFDPMLPMPASFTRIRNGDRLTFGQRRWEVMTAAGHADEHASFYCADDRILIAGDQILSRITPVIGVFPSEPLADPLSAYLASMPRFRALPDDTFVLPSHGVPFHGLHIRVDQIIRHHLERLDRLAELMTGPKSAFELAAGLFPDAMAGGHEMLAMAETLAHINHLVVIGRATRHVGAEGELTFTTTAAKAAAKTKPRAKAAKAR